MFRFLLICLIIYFLISFLKRTLIRHLESKVQRQFGRRDGHSTTTGRFGATSPDISTKNQSATEILAPCPKCGTFFQKEKGVRHGGKWFCSKECTH